jgi:hypothetical protein
MNPYRGLIVVLLICLSRGAWAGEGETLPIGAFEHPEGATGDSFGQALAVAGNYLAVGAPSRTREQHQLVGAVYFFDRTTRAFERRLDGPLSASLPQFGKAMAAVQDDRLAISARGANQAWLYRVPEGDIIAELMDPTADSGGFGAALASDGEQVAVSDVFEDAVYLYSAESGAFLRSVANPSATAFSFGTALLIENQFLYVGSMYSAMQPLGGSGEALILDLADDSLFRQYGDPTNGQNLMGANLALASNLLAVGPGYDDGFPYGYLYVYDYASESTEPVATIRSPGLQAQNYNDRFGWRLGTLREELLVATPGGPYDGNRRGVVYRYDPRTGAEIGRLVPPADISDSRRFADGMTIHGDVVYVGVTGFGIPGSVSEFVIPASPESAGWVVR